MPGESRPVAQLHRGGGHHRAWRLTVDGRRVELGAAHVVVAEEDLAVEVRAIDGVVVDEHQRADAGLGEGAHGRRAEPAHADDDDLEPC